MPASSGSSSKGQWCACRFLHRASLTADEVPQLLHLPEADSDVQLSNESTDESPNEPDQAADIAASLERLAMGGHAPANQGQESSGGAKAGQGVEDAEKAAHAPANGLAPDLDFQEFLQRQRTFMEVCSCQCLVLGLTHADLCFTCRRTQIL